MTTTTGRTILVCADCIPAGIEAKRLDDYRGHCKGCGAWDGNLRRVILSPVIVKRGDYVTTTGTIITL